jgi:trans-2-enoyl-CoA reductase
MDVFSIAVGAVGVGVAYFLYLAVTKGLPAAWAWLKAKSTAAESRLASIEADVAALKAAVPPAPVAIPAVAVTAGGAK